jgi:hypothetical protein
MLRDNYAEYDRTKRAACPTMAKRPCTGSYIAEGECGHQMVVDPDNRLNASPLENRWEEPLRFDSS